MRETLLLCVDHFFVLSRTDVLVLRPCFVFVRCCCWSSTSSMCQSASMGSENHQLQWTAENYGHFEIDLWFGLSTCSNCGRYSSRASREFLREHSVVSGQLGVYDRFEIRRLCSINTQSTLERYRCSSGCPKLWRSLYWIISFARWWTSRHHLVCRLLIVEANFFLWILGMVMPPRRIKRWTISKHGAMGRVFQSMIHPSIQDQETVIPLSMMWSMELKIRMSSFHHEHVSLNKSAPSKTLSLVFLERRGATRTKDHFFPRNIPRLCDSNNSESFRFQWSQTR